MRDKPLGNNKSVNTVTILHSYEPIYISIYDLSTF